MADQAELNEKIARLEAALGAAAKALEAAGQAPDLSEDLARAQEALAAAEARADALQIEVTERDAALADAKAAAEALAAEQVTTRVAPPMPEPSGGGDGALRSKVDEMSAAMEALRAGSPGAVDESLKAELAALRAARELDLAEMQALLAELEPMLEAANA